MVSFTDTLNVPEPAVKFISIPSEVVALLALKPVITQLSMYTARADVMLTPFMPVPAPLIDRLRRRTILVCGAPLPESLTFTPFVPAARMPASTPAPSMVIDLVIVTAPKPPESIQLISPPSAVFEIAPANVLQGAVRLHGLTSSPTPDTQVRVACARATPDHNQV